MSANNSRATGFSIDSKFPPFLSESRTNENRETEETNKIFQLSQLYASKKKMLKISQRGREESPFPFSTALLTRPYFCLFLCPDTRNMITLTTDGFYDLVGTVESPIRG